MERCGRARRATDDSIIGRMRFACWITKATDTHSEYLLLFDGDCEHASASQCYVVRSLPLFLGIGRTAVLLIQRF